MASRLDPPLQPYVLPYGQKLPQTSPDASETTCHECCGGEQWCIITAKLHELTEPTAIVAEAESERDCSTHSYGESSNDSFVIRRHMWRCCLDLKRKYKHDGWAFWCWHS